MKKLIQLIHPTMTHLSLRRMKLSLMRKLIQGIHQTITHLRLLRTTRLKIKMNKLTVGLIEMYQQVTRTKKTLSLNYHTPF